MAEDTANSISFQVRWRVVLQTARKLFCHCLTGQAMDLVGLLERPGHVGQVGRGALSVRQQPSDRDRDPQKIGDFAKWPSQFEQKTSVVTGECVLPTNSFQAYESGKFGGRNHCAYEQEEMAPALWCDQALGMAVALARLCEAKLSNPWVVVRERVMWPLQHWRRRSLIAIQGSIPLFDQVIGVRLYLQESLDFWGRHTRTSFAWEDHWRLRGMPEVEWISEPIPASLVPALAQRLRDLTAATGWTYDAWGSWSLDCLRHQRLLGTWEMVRNMRSLQHCVGASVRMDFTPLGHEHHRYLRTSWFPFVSPGVLCEPDPELPFVSGDIDANLPLLPNHAPVGWNVRMELALLDLSADVIDGVLCWGHAALFLECMKTNPKVPVWLWGELLFRWPTSLRRKGIPVHQLTPERYLAVASLHGLNRCTREVLYDLLAFTALYPEIPVRHILTQKMGISPQLQIDWQKQLPAWIDGMEPPRKKQWPAREKYWMGRLMRYLRGKVPGWEIRDALLAHFAIHPPTAYDRSSHFLTPSRR